MQSTDYNTIELFARAGEFHGLQPELIGQVESFRIDEVKDEIQETLNDLAGVTYETPALFRIEVRLRDNRTRLIDADREKQREVFKKRKAEIRATGLKRQEEADGDAAKAKNVYRARVHHIVPIVIQVD